MARFETGPVPRSVTLRVTRERYWFEWNRIRLPFLARLLFLARLQEAVFVFRVS